MELNRYPYSQNVRIEWCIFDSLQNFRKNNDTTYFARDLGNVLSIIGQ